MGTPLERALSIAVGDSGRDLRVRLVAAGLLRDIGADMAPFSPLLQEFIESGDSGNRDLKTVVHSMTYGHGSVTEADLDVLLSVLHTGTALQRYWVVNEIAFFEGPRICRRVRRALIGVLDEFAQPPEVRAWAAERLHLHISRETVRACLRALEDPEPEVRLWAAYTLGCAAAGWGDRPHPIYAQPVEPAMEKLLEDDGVVPGWWSVRREAQAHLATLRGEAKVARLQAEIQAILSDPSASREDKLWADFNDCS